MADADPNASPAEAVARLVTAVQDWARETFPAPAGGQLAPECQWCPLCQFVSVLRGERPELTERVAEVGAAVAAAVRTLVDTAGHTHGQDGERPPRVEHIDLGDTDA